MKMTKAVLALTPVALSLMIAGCTNEELVNERITKYEQNFKETFGDIDPTHDWSMATAVTANIDLSKAPAGTYEVKIYSEKNGYLLKKAIVENNAQLHFDAIKGEKYVRVLARKTSALGLTAINGYFPVEDGVVNTAKDTRAASTADQCNTTIDWNNPIDLGTYRGNGYLYYKFNRTDDELNLTSNYQVRDWVEVPQDNGYYITKKDGCTYKEGDNGIYLVTHNGVQTEYDMHEIWDITNQPLTYYWKEGSEYRTLYSFFPACYQYVTYKEQSWGGTFYNLNDVYKSLDKDKQVRFGDLLPLVSANYPNAYFHEFDDNRSLYEDILDYDIEYVLTDKGEITYTYVFHGSEYHNKLGYFYWFEDANMTDEEKKQARINAPRLIFMQDTFSTYDEDETGKPNLQCFDDPDGSNPETPGGMEMPSWADDPNKMEIYKDKFMQGKTYHLAYFGEDYHGDANYEFPKVEGKELHVAFFLLTQFNTRGETLGNGLFYSIKDMNMETGVNNKYWWAAQGEGSSSYDPSQMRPNEGEVSAVTYTYNGQIVMGFEDGVDKDENDMLFFISAPIVPPVSITEETEEEMSWVVACEDLGGTYDYDFNDIVFNLGQLSVYSTTTITTEGQSSSTISLNKAELFLRPLAAGGTLPAYIYFDKNGDGINSDDELIGEAHDLLKAGAPTTVPINVGSMSVDPTKVARIKLADIETPAVTEEGIKSYIAEQVAKIKIVVSNGDAKTALEVTAPDENGSNIPQMLILPQGWDWPTEHQHIFTVYPQFKEWSTDKTKNGWITDPIGSFYKNPFK